MSNGLPGSVESLEEDVRPLFTLRRPAQSESQFHAPVASFAYLTGGSSLHTNDYVAFAEPRSKPVPTSNFQSLEYVQEILSSQEDAAFPSGTPDRPWQRLVAMQPRPPLADTGRAAAPAAAPRPAPREIDWSPVEVQSRQVLRNKLDDIQRLCGQKFTLDATCSDTGADKHFPRCCAARGAVPHAVGPFQDLATLRNEHVWASLTADTAAAVMARYLELKAASPTSASGCFLVPYRPDCEWFDHFSHMQLLKEYSEGTSVFFVTDGKHRRYLPGIPGPYRVYYDPPDPSIGASASKPKFLLPGRIFSGPGKIFIDSGANTQYIGADTCRAMDATIRELDDQPRTVQVGDGHEAEVIGTCRVPVQIGAYKGCVTALVLEKFSKDFDLVLGESWLKAYKAQLNYGAYSAMRLRVANRVVIIRVGQRGAKSKLNTLVAPAYIVQYAPVLYQSPSSRLQKLCRKD